MTLSETAISLCTNWAERPCFRIGPEKRGLPPERAFTTAVRSVPPRLVVGCDKP